MSAKVFRSTPRIIALTFTFLVGAAFFAGAAAMAKERTGPAVGMLVVAAIFFLFAMRLPFTRAVAAPHGITLHSALGTTRVPWDAIASISSGTTEQDGSLISVRTPILNLTTGKNVAVRPAAFYSSAKAAQVAAELESLRKQYTKT